MTVENIKSIANSDPASSPEIIDALRRALDRAYKYPVRSVSIAMHLTTGGYETIEEFPK
jgi:hypothetical protein